MGRPGTNETTVFTVCSEKCKLDNLTTGGGDAPSLENQVLESGRARVQAIELWCVLGVPQVVRTIPVLNEG